MLNVGHSIDRLTCRPVANARYVRPTLLIASLGLHFLAAFTTFRLGRNVSLTFCPLDPRPSLIGWARFRRASIRLLPNLGIDNPPFGAALRCSSAAFGTTLMCSLWPLVLGLLSWGSGVCLRCGCTCQ